MRFTYMQQLFQDIRFAVRQLTKNPGFTLVAILSLALGIGANTALFSVVHGVLINPYPYARPHEIWAPQVEGLKPNEGYGHRLSDFLELKKLPVAADVMATTYDNVLLTGEFAPESFFAVRLSGNGFNFLGVPPVIGRTIQPSDIRPSGEPEHVVVLSHRLWQRLFDADTNVLGKSMRLNDELHTIVGVMPPRFGWFGSDAFWLPLGTDTRDNRWVMPIMRLKPGVTPEVAEQAVHGLHQRLAQENPDSFPKGGYKTKLNNYLDITVASGEMQTSLKLLFGAVGFLLLIACANVANLQLARATSRAREMAIRLSVGAGRWQIIRQLLTESVLLSVLGGALGLLFAYWITNLMVALMPSFFVPNEARIVINGQVLTFCIIASVLTGIVFGLAPAFHSSKPDLNEALKDTGKGAGNAARGGKTREVLVVAEVALAVVLLMSAGLTIRSFLTLQKTNLGFNPDRVMNIDVPLNAKQYETLEQRNRFAQELLERVKRLPGMEAAVIGNGGLPYGGPESAYTIQGVTEPKSDTPRMTVYLGSEDYLRLLGIRLKQGRMLTEREVSAAEPFGVINEAAAELWGTGVDPIGKQIRLELLEKPGQGALVREGSSPYVTVVGIMENTRNEGLKNKTKPAVLISYKSVAPTQRTLSFRTEGDPALAVKAIQEQVRSMDEDQPLRRPMTVHEVLGFETVQPRFVMALFAFFASLGLSLAMAGIYSVLSYLVTRRTHEIGVRMALGAQRKDVLELIFRLGGRLVLLGLVIGVLAGLGAARLLRSQLYQVSYFDPVALVGVILILGGIAAAACYIPAKRATKVDPLTALRYE